MKSQQHDYLLLKNWEKEEKSAIFIHFIEYKNKNVCQLINQLVELDKTLPWEERKIANHCYLFNSDYHDTSLTALESCCLFYLIRSKSESNVSQLLNISAAETNRFECRLNENRLGKAQNRLMALSKELAPGSPRTGFKHVIPVYASLIRTTNP